MAKKGKNGRLRILRMLKMLNEEEVKRKWSEATSLVRLRLSSAG